MERIKKSMFRGVTDAVLDYLKLGYNYGYRKEHLDGFYCSIDGFYSSIDVYKEDYSASDDDDSYSIGINFTYGFYDFAAMGEKNVNFTSKGTLDIYYPETFAMKTPEQVHDIVYGMTFAYMQNQDE